MRCVIGLTNNRLQNNTFEHWNALHNNNKNQLLTMKCDCNSWIPGVVVFVPWGGKRVTARGRVVARVGGPWMINHAVQLVAARWWPHTGTRIRRQIQIGQREIYTSVQFAEPLPRTEPLQICRQTHARTQSNHRSIGVSSHRTQGSSGSSGEGREKIKTLKVIEVLSIQGETKKPTNSTRFHNRMN